MTEAPVRRLSFRGPIRLQSNMGSLAPVEEVFAFDAVRGVALVRFGGHRSGDLESVTLNELEALDADNKFVPVEQVVRLMVGEDDVIQ